MTTEIKNTKVQVSGLDRITGSEGWSSTIGDLDYSGWELSEDEIDEILSGGKVKLYSPNGRRVINIKLA